MLDLGQIRPDVRDLDAEPVVAQQTQPGRPAAVAEGVADEFAHDQFGDVRQFGERPAFQLGADQTARRSGGRPVGRERPDHHVRVGLREGLRHEHHGVVETPVTAAVGPGPRRLAAVRQRDRRAVDRRTQAFQQDVDVLVPVLDQPVGVHHEAAAFRHLRRHLVVGDDPRAQGRARGHVQEGGTTGGVDHQGGQVTRAGQPVRPLGVVVDGAQAGGDLVLLQVAGRQVEPGQYPFR